MPNIKQDSGFLGTYSNPQGYGYGYGYGYRATQVITDAEHFVKNNSSITVAGKEFNPLMVGAALAGAWLLFRRK